MKWRVVLGAGNLARVYSVAHTDDLFKRRAEITRARHARHQELLCRGGHDDGFHLRRISLVPVRVVAVAVNHQVNVPSAGLHQFARTLYRGLLRFAGRTRARPSLPRSF